MSGQDLTALMFASCLCDACSQMPSGHTSRFAGPQDLTEPKNTPADGNPHSCAADVLVCPNINIDAGRSTPYALSTSSRNFIKLSAVNGSSSKTICLVFFPCFWRYSVIFIQRISSSKVRMTEEARLASLPFDVIIRHAALAALRIGPLVPAIPWTILKASLIGFSTPD